MAEPLTVIGAGPVGSLLALFLARRGHEVRVFERRPDMRSVGIAAGRSINLAVSTRGLHALHQVGLDEEVLRQAIPMRGQCGAVSWPNLAGLSTLESCYLSPNGTMPSASGLGVTRHP